MSDSSGAFGPVGFMATGEIAAERGSGTYLPWGWRTGTIGTRVVSQRAFRLLLGRSVTPACPGVSVSPGRGCSPVLKGARAPSTFLAEPVRDRKSTRLNSSHVK